MSTGWAANPMVAFDLESTAADPMEARIVTACSVAVNDGAPSPVEWLVNPGIEIPAETTAIHGITTEKARAEGRDPALALPEIKWSLTVAWSAGWPVVGYNVSYDLTVLDQELRRHGLDGLDEVGPVIDPLVLDRHVDKYRKGSRKLTAACDYYRVALNGAHDSTQDALAAARVAWRIAQRNPTLAALDLDALMELQAAAHAEWATHLTEYYASQGKDEVIDTSWPIRRVATCP